MAALLLLAVAFLPLSTCTSGRHAKRGGDAVLCPGSEAPLSPNYDAATREDGAFNSAFQHCFMTVKGVQMHAVEGGVQNGPLAVMLHGWPQSWYEFRQLLPAVARTHHVLAIDLPGLGDSTGAPSSMAKAALAHYIRAFVRKRASRTAAAHGVRLWYKRGITLIAHDLGVGVAFAYAAKFAHEVREAVFMDYLVPGAGCTADSFNELSYHFAFFREEQPPPGLAELLIDDEALPPPPIQALALVWSGACWYTRQAWSGSRYNATCMLEGPQA